MFPRYQIPIVNYLKDSLRYGNVGNLLDRLADRENPASVHSEEDSSLPSPLKIPRDAGNKTRIVPDREDRFTGLRLGIIRMITF